MILQKEYANKEDAIKEARHWLLNTQTHLLIIGNKDMADGIDIAIKTFDKFLSRVKK